MEVLHDAQNPARKLKNPTVTIGAFDGVHLGHRTLLEKSLGAAKRDGGEAVVLTFEPHPGKVLTPQNAPLIITSSQRKLELLENAGVAVTVLQPFDANFAAIEADQFVQQILLRGLGAVRVVVGYDFTYGYRRAGTANTLVDAGQRWGFAVEVIPALSVEDIVCSSTRVREFLRQGQLDKAGLLLGRPVEVVGTVVKGHGRGKTLGFPTANLALEAELLPPRGVYAGWALGCDEALPRRPVVVNIGYAPTFQQTQLTVEAHVIDFATDLVGRRLIVQLVKHVRPEQRFASVDELSRQIQRDVACAREILR